MVTKSGESSRFFHAFNLDFIWGMLSLLSHYHSYATILRKGVDFSLKVQTFSFDYSSSVEFVEGAGGASSMYRPQDGKGC